MCGYLTGKSHGCHLVYNYFLYGRFTHLYAIFQKASFNVAGFRRLYGLVYSFALADDSTPSKV